MTRVSPQGRAIYVLLPALILFCTLAVTAEDRPGRKGKVTPLANQATAPDEPGMASVPAGSFKMGIDKRDLVKMFGDIKKPNKKTHKDLKDKAKRDAWWWSLMSETPEHKAETEAYSIDVFNVTNAQYRLFLEETAKGTFFTRGKIRKIGLVAQEIFGNSAEAHHAESLFWINEAKLTGQQAWPVIEKLNKGAIQAILDEFNDGRPEPAQIKEFGKLPDQIRVDGWKHFLLPENVALTVYNRTIPDHWPKAKVTDEMLSWPVVFVNAIDADAFAAWAGKHLPSEEEWEKAARGPKNWLYPWGPKWDCEKQRNLLVWYEALPMPKGPASPYKNRPVEVTKLPEGASPYGLHHMLGNTYEWTSSVPVLYPGSAAEKRRWLGNPMYRTLRSCSYGVGTKDRKMALGVRNTHRALVEVDAGISISGRYEAVGFRCARYPTPTRDVVTYWLARMEEDGILPTVMARKLEPKRALGVELTNYDATGGKSQVFVKGGSTILTAIPLEKLGESQANVIVENSKDPAKEPQVFAWLFWNGDTKIEILRRKEIVSETPAEGETPAPTENAEEKKDDKKKGDKKKSPRKKDKKKTPGGKQAPPAAGEPSTPKFEEVREWLTADAKKAYYIGILEARLALFLQKASGLELVGFLPVQTGAGQVPNSPAITKVSPKAWRPTAMIDAAKGFFRVKMLLGTRSSTSDDVFLVDVALKIQGAPSGAWRQSNQ